MTRETDAGGMVQVELLLVEGHRESFSLPEGSPLLRDLLAALAGGAGRLIEIPLDGGRRALSIAADRVVGVLTEPPVQSADSRLEEPAPRSERPAATAPVETGRSVERLRHPQVVLFEQIPVDRRESFERFERMAEELRAGFERRGPERRARLRAIVEELAQDTLVVSTFNAGYGPMFRNWAASCDRHGIPAREFTVLFPTDTEADRLARDHGFVTFFDGESMGEVPRHAHERYGDGDFALAMFPKTAAIQDLLDLGVDLLRQDMDLVWLEDPRPRLAALAREGDLDLLFMKDQNPRFQPLYYNSGFVHIRSNELTRFTWRAVLDAMSAILVIRSEQEVVQQIVACHRERGLRTGLLPDEFVDGRLMNLAIFHGQPLPERPIVAHASWTKNLAEKIERFRALGMWFLD